MCIRDRFTIVGMILLPIAVALALNFRTEWQPEGHRVLYFLPSVAVVLAFATGWGLMRMEPWARVGAMFSVTVIAICGGLVVRAWFWMTATTPADWDPFLFSAPVMSERGPLVCYIPLAFCAVVATVWCLTRGHVADAFRR